MAAFVNDRTVLIMAATPRFAPPTDRGMFLSPSTAVFKVAADGQSASPASFTFKANLLNMSGVVTFTCSAGITPTVNGNELTITYANFSAVSGTVTATIVVEGVVYTQVATVTKVADGSAGAAGVAGTRGNVDISAVTAGSVWSDTEANAALQAAGYGAPRLRDMVHLYKADRTFGVQKVFDGFNWVAVDYVYNGNMFVKGSILPESIDTRGITVKDAAGNVIFGSGTNLDKSRINANFGTNLMYNGDFSCGLDGWSLAGSSGPAVSGMGVNLSGGDWWMSLTPNLPGANIFWASQSDAYRNSSLSDGTHYYEFYSLKVPVVAGRNYIVSAITGAHRCSVNVFMFFYNSSDQLLSASSGAGSPSGVSANPSEYSGGKTLAGYKRIYSSGVAPAGAAYCRVMLRKFATVAGSSDSYMFVGRVMIEEAPAGVTTPGIWSIGQSVTPITAANASTYIQSAAIGLAHINKASITNLQALSSVIGLLRTATSGQRSELSDIGLQLFNASNVPVIQVGMF